MQITEYHLDALKEIFNIGVGRGASILSEMLESRILLQIPRIYILKNNDISSLKEKINMGSHASVKMGFHGSFDGTVALTFEPKTASTIVGVLTGEESSDVKLDSVRSGTLCEVGNMIINSLMGSITNILKKEVEYSLPVFTEESMEVVLDLDSDEDKVVCIADTEMRIEKIEASGKLFVILKMGIMEQLLEAIENAK